MLAKKGRNAFRCNFQFGAERGGRRFELKQVVPIVVCEAGDIVVITVYVFYFWEEER